jgi:hypothetical protein
MHPSQIPGLWWLATRTRLSTLAAWRSKIMRTTGHADIAFGSVFPAATELQCGSTAGRGRERLSGGFLGLDNIGVLTGSALPPAGINQADGTAWWACTVSICWRR